MHRYGVRYSVLPLLVRTSADLCFFTIPAPYSCGRFSAPEACHAFHSTPAISPHQYASALQAWSDFRQQAHLRLWSFLPHSSVSPPVRIYDFVLLSSVQPVEKLIPLNKLPTADFYNRHVLTVKDIVSHSTGEAHCLNVICR